MNVCMSLRTLGTKRSQSPGWDPPCPSHLSFTGLCDLICLLSCFSRPFQLPISYASGADTVTHFQTLWTVINLGGLRRKRNQRSGTKDWWKNRNREQIERIESKEAKGGERIEKEVKKKPKINPKVGKVWTYAFNLSTRDTGQADLWSRTDRAI